MPLFGTVRTGGNPADYPQPGVGGLVENAPGGWDVTSSDESGQVVQVPANFGTEGGLVNYRWGPIRWKPYVPDPYKQMFNSPVRGFPQRELPIDTTILGYQQYSTGEGQSPAVFVPPGTAEISFKDETF